MSSYSFRIAQPSDHEICLAFDCTDPTASRSDHEKSDLIKAKIDTGEIYLAVAADKHPVGYLSIDRMWPMMLPLVSWVYVAPAWRNNKIAHDLFDFSMKDLKKRGYDRVLISTQSDRIQMLQSLREDLGLKEIGGLRANPDESIEEIFFIKTLE